MVADPVDPEQDVEDRLRAELAAGGRETRTVEAMSVATPQPGGPPLGTNLEAELLYLEGWRERVAGFDGIAELHRTLTEVLLDLERSAGAPFSSHAPRAETPPSSTELLATQRLAAARLGRWTEVRSRLKKLEAARPPPGGLGFRFPRTANWTQAANGPRYLGMRTLALSAVAGVAVLTVLFVTLIAGHVADFAAGTDWVSAWLFPLLLSFGYGGAAAAFVEAAHEADLARRSVHLAARLEVRRLDHELKGASRATGSVRGGM